ncbi:MAG: septal ring lytic transglycosylase RlpA family protein [Fibrobacterota bacterium]|nr:septal ring lytic transglycosylase RlpA family protein [Fibrobacterota bacterium]QQS05664.1 MAG: septal ring lytic transglycosylase RlpA family protein [Fibrobacterota bacterium]
MRTARILGAATLGLWLVGCGGTLPHRTGYDRQTGTWKPAPGGSKKNPTTPKPSPAEPKVAQNPAPPTDSTLAPPPPPPPASGEVMRGEASFYGKELAGRPTASGEIFDPDLLTCAHRTLPFQTQLRVRYPKKGTSVEVRVNDRGPRKPQRIIDLSRAAADDLGLTADGIGQVEIEILP